MMYEQLPIPGLEPIHSRLPIPRKPKRQSLQNQIDDLKRRVLQLEVELCLVKIQYPRD